MEDNINLHNSNRYDDNHGSCDCSDDSITPLIWCEQQS